MGSTITSRLHDLDAGTYQIDSSRSKVSYRGKHMWGLGTVHAEFAVRSGQIRVADSLTDSSVTATIDAASFTSNSARRDRDVRSAGLLDVAAFPDITFSSTTVRQAGDEIVVEGTVTAHGNTAPVSVTVTAVESDSDAIRMRARAEHLDRYAFGIAGSKGIVGRFLDLDLDVLAIR